MKKNVPALKPALFQLGIDLAAVGITVAALKSSHLIEKLLELTQSSDGEPAGVVQTIATTTSFAAIIQPAIKQALQTISATVLPLGNDDLPKLEAFHRQCIETSNPILEYFPQGVRDALKIIDDDFEVSLKILRAHRTPAKYKSVDDLFNLLMTRQCIWLGQPRICQNYFETCDFDLRADLFRRQPARMKLPIRAVTNQIIAASIRGLANQSRCNYLILGKPGVGKTTLIWRVASFLGAGVIPMVYGNIEAPHLTGNTFVAVTKEVPGRRNLLDMQGEVRDNVRQFGVRNCISLIDEFQALPRFTAPALHSAWNAYFNPDVSSSTDGLENLNHLIAFVLSNDSRADFSASFLNRFLVIDASDLDDEALNNVFDARLGEYEERVKMGIGLKDVQQPEPPKRRTTKLRTMSADLAVKAASAAQQIVEGMKERILARNTDPGGRSVQRITQLILDYIFVEKLIAGDADFEVAKEEVEGVFELAIKELMSAPEGDDSEKSG